MTSKVRDRKSSKTRGRSEGGYGTGFGARAFENNSLSALWSRVRGLETVLKDVSKSISVLKDMFVGSKVRSRMRPRKTVEVEYESYSLVPGVPVEKLFSLGFTSYIAKRRLVKKPSNRVKHSRDSPWLNRASLQEHDGRKRRSGKGSRARRNVRRRRNKIRRTLGLGFGGVDIEEFGEDIVCKDGRCGSCREGKPCTRCGENEEVVGEVIGTPIKFTKASQQVQVRSDFDVGSRLYELEKRASDEISMFDRISSRVRALQPSTLAKRGLRAYALWKSSEMAFRGGAALYRWMTYKPSVALQLIQGAQEAFGRGTTLGFAINSLIYVGTKFVPGGLALATVWSAFYNYPIMHRMTYSSTALEALRLSIPGMTFFLNAAGFVQDTILDLKTLVSFLRRFFADNPDECPNRCQDHSLPDPCTQAQAEELARAARTCSKCKG